MKTLKPKEIWILKKRDPEILAETWIRLPCIGRPNKLARILAYMKIWRSHCSDCKDLSCGIQICAIW